MVDVAANYGSIVHRIGEAAEKCRRNPEEIKLLAAAKAQSVESIQAAIAAGVTLVGENYVQEAEEKRKTIRGSVEWHMIGHLQRNKVKAAVALFDLIESLDSVALARELDKEGSKQGKKVRAFVEVKLSDEESKSGILVDEVEGLLRAAADLSHLSIEGLMTVPPFRDNPEEVRRYFRLLRELQTTLRGRAIPNVHLKELSMGMTHDYPVAIEEGATIVRIGTALFGPRKV
jgi:pyridoxal phosphate enzyme (YggS family)